MLITNSSISNTRGFSPFFLTYFKHPIFPFQNFEKQNPLYQENSYVADLINKSQKDISTAANNSLNSFQEYKNQFDNKSSISKFELGDLIYIHTTQRGAMHHKFANCFKGPYIIVAFLANNNLQLKPIHGGKPYVYTRITAKRELCVILRYGSMILLLPIKLDQLAHLTITNQPNFFRHSWMMTT